MSDNVIETVRGRVDIVELVGEQVRLLKAGRAYKALCPFHSEKTPSFSVNPERQSWRCFGQCADGGDVFKFVMKRDGVDFPTALRTLAERAGVELGRGPDPQAREAHERLFAANEAAITFFRQALTGSSAGAEAREYVARRGFDEATIDGFELGFAPEGWDNLRGYLLGKGFRDEELLEAGVLTSGERGTPYDRFRRRLIFPIRDERGRAVGFGGRALDDAKPKYLNTPQTPLFDKGGLLFALDRAREAIRTAGEAVIVEGYVDAITAHQFGYRNVVATLGTALTPRHIQLLRRLTRRVTLAMDADTAGIEAAMRGEEVAREATGDGDRADDIVRWDGLVQHQARSPVEVRVFTVPSGKDPDEAIRETPGEWTAWVGAAVSPFDFRLRQELARTDMADPRARIELADRMLPLLLKIDDPALQAAYLSRLAQEASVPEQTLALHLRELTPRKARGERIVIRERVRDVPAAVEEAAERAPAARPDPVEAFVLALLLRLPELRQSGEALAPALFQQTAHRALFELWRDAEALSDEAVPAELRPLLDELRRRDLAAFTPLNAEPALADAVAKLRHRTLIEQKRLLDAELAELHGQVDEGASLRLMQRLTEAPEAAELEDVPEPVIAHTNHLRTNHYLSREALTVEWELRTRQTPHWAGTVAEPDAGGAAP
ncbi:MAG TPA: DNA primase [Dehalococcoidia bacterium]|nr:DNA primase [Dehalococcoidia bacterium]